MDILRSMLVEDVSISASDVKTYDLPVNALSHIYITLKALNVTDEATLAEILARLTKITVSRLGESRFDLSGADLFAFDAIHQGALPILGNRIATDNATRFITLMIPFGRKLYDPSECHPSTRKGEFHLRIEFSATETACDGLILSIGTVELLGATPTKHLKVTTLNHTPTATGDSDQELPIGNPLAGLLVWGTTVVTTTAWTNTVEKVKLLIDNSEKYVASAHWEDVHGALAERINMGGYIAAAAGDDDLVKYGYLDFSPEGRDDLLVPTAGLSSIKLRMTAGDTNPVRILPVELEAV